jgi:hypothetical protein
MDNATTARLGFDFKPSDVRPSAEELDRAKRLIPKALKKYAEPKAGLYRCPASHLAKWIESLDSELTRAESRWAIFELAADGAFSAKLEYPKIFWPPWIIPGREPTYGECRSADVFDDVWIIATTEDRIFASQQGKVAASAPDPEQDLVTYEQIELVTQSSRSYLYRLRRQFKLSPVNTPKGREKAWFRYGDWQRAFKAKPCGIPFPDKDEFKKILETNGSV